MAIVPLIGREQLKRNADSVVNVKMFLTGIVPESSQDAVLNFEEYFKESLVASKGHFQHILANLVFSRRNNCLKSKMYMQTGKNF